MHHLFHLRRLIVSRTGKNHLIYHLQLILSYRNGGINSSLYCLPYLHVLLHQIENGLLQKDPIQIRIQVRYYKVFCSGRIEQLLRWIQWRSLWGWLQHDYDLQLALPRDIACCSQCDCWLSSDLWRFGLALWSTCDGLDHSWCCWILLRHYFCHRRSAILPID